MPEPQKNTPRADERIETWYLAPAFEEAEIAAEWLKKHNPAALDEERLVTELNLHQLSRFSEVVLLVRKPKPRQNVRQAQPVKEAPDGQRYTVHVEPEEMIDEVQACGPVKCADYWEHGANRFSSKLRRAPFMEAIGKIATPWRTAFSDAASRKNGETPDWLTLRNC